MLLRCFSAFSTIPIGLRQRLGWAKMGFASLLACFAKTAGLLAANKVVSAEEGSGFCRL